MQKQLKDLSEIELKALAYDLIAKLEESKKMLDIINNELSGRANKTIEEKTKMEEEKIVEVTGTEPVETGEVTANEVAE